MKKSLFCLSFMLFFGLSAFAQDVQPVDQEGLTEIVLNQAPDLGEWKGATSSAMSGHIDSWNSWVVASFTWGGESCTVTSTNSSNEIVDFSCGSMGTATWTNYSIYQQLQILYDGF